MLLTILNGVSGLFAVAAAILWIGSARIATPQAFAIHVQDFGGGYGGGHSPELVALANALVIQSKMSARAAICAAIAAFAQFLGWIAAVW